MAYGGASTIEETINFLQDLQCKGISEVPLFDYPHSYRGYYDDLSLNPNPKSKMPISDLITLIQSCVGQTYEGYKGGDYVMDELSEIYAAEYSCCGISLTTYIKDWLLERLLPSKSEEGSL